MGTAAPKRRQGKQVLENGKKPKMRMNGERMRGGGEGQARRPGPGMNYTSPPDMVGKVEDRLSSASQTW